jgi:hypothetical protein
VASYWGGGQQPQQPAYPMQGAVNPGADMWGGNTGYKAGGGFGVMPDPADYQSHDVFMDAMSAYMGGGSSNAPAYRPPVPAAPSFDQVHGGPNLPPEILSGRSGGGGVQQQPNPGNPIGSAGTGGGAWDTIDMWGRSYLPGGSKGGVMPDAADYQSHDSFMNAMNAYMRGGGGAALGFGGISPGEEAALRQQQAGLGGQPYGPGYFDNTFGSANDMQGSRDSIAKAWMNQQMAGGDSRYTQGGNIYMFGAPGSGTVGGPTDTFSGWDYQRGTPGGFDQRYYAPQAPMSYNQGVDELARLYNEVLGPKAGTGQSSGTLNPSDIMLRPYDPVSAAGG